MVDVIAKLQEAARKAVAAAERLEKGGDAADEDEGEAGAEAEVEAEAEAEAPMETEPEENGSAEAAALDGEPQQHSDS